MIGKTVEARTDLRRRRKVRRRGDLHTNTEGGSDPRQGATETGERHFTRSSNVAPAKSLRRVPHDPRVCVRVCICVCVCVGENAVQQTGRAGSPSSGGLHSSSQPPQIEEAKTRARSRISATKQGRGERESEREGKKEPKQKKTRAKILARYVVVDSLPWRRMH